MKEGAETIFSTSPLQPVQPHHEKGKLNTAKQHSTIETTDEMTSSKTSLDPRSWFQSISREEKAKAMCLGDRKFIKLFLESTRGSANTKSVEITKKIRIESVEQILGSDRSKPTESAVVSQPKNMGSVESTSSKQNSLEQDKEKLGQGENKDKESLSCPPGESPRLVTETHEHIIQDEDSFENEEACTEEKEDQGTTIHFETGIKITIPHNSQANKKVIANVNQGKKAVNPSVPSTSSTDTTEEQVPTNEVHQHVEFGALKNNSSSSTITESKKFANRAMKESSYRSSSSTIQKNLRFVFSASQKFSRTNSNSTHKESLLLTLDPTYLSNGQFLDDAENIIETRCGSKYSFLSEEFRIQGEDNDSALHWFCQCLELEGKETPFVVLLLARIEQAILESYRSYRGMKRVKKENLPTYLRVKLCRKVILTELFKMKKSLVEYNLLGYEVDIPHFSIKPIQVQDLLMVPCDKIYATYNPDLKTTPSSDPVDALVFKWNRVITAAEEVVNKSRPPTDNEVMELFAEDTSIKKSKSKKKKKRKKKNNKTKMENQNDKSQNTKDDLSKKEEPKIDISKVQQETESKSESPADCGTSSSSVVSAVSQSSSKKKSTKEKQTQTLQSSRNDASTETTTISKVNGVQSVLSTGRVEESSQDQNDEGWETVESKKNREKKNSSNKQNEKSNSQGGSGSSRKNKNKKNRNRNRQKDKEQAKANLDSLEEGIAKRGTNTTKALMEERNKRQGSGNKKKVESRPAAPPKQTSKTGATIRDVVLGNLGGSGNSRFPSTENSVTQSSIGTNAKDKASSPSSKKKNLVADQNTASTLQETVSATSRSFANADDSAKTASKRIPLSTKSSIDATNNNLEGRDNSSDSTCDDMGRSLATSTKKGAAPPLQTLVGPGNLNSANSSVASSLEAPHATRHGANKHASSKESDVGYHLLKVCERLSTDMNSFMTRRSLALAQRRQERGALLASLQETVQSIWMENCHVEMYGSCATKLDLPSSDLDVVVCGFNSIDKENSKKSGSDDNEESGTSTGTSMTSDMQAYANQFYPPLSVNGTRVYRLASELERVPWAVQVKAIPTASVPVIKILADPSRLPGAAGTDWMIQQQQMAAAAVAATDMNSGKMPVSQSSSNHKEGSSSGDENEDDENGQTNSNAMNHHIPSITHPNQPPSYHTAIPPWRGADVMNGLLSLDITFEGPEHGGLGSTAFSEKIVKEACLETGLPPEQTPVVQVLMVIKELLAQRRLNEPFSGGLSSYAILLLVVAVVKERRIIKKELEKIEKQRRAVEGSSVNQEGVVDSKSTVWPSEKFSKGKANSEKKNESTAGPSLTKRSSWASIAMKSSSNHTQTDDDDNDNEDEIVSKKTEDAQPSVSSKAEVKSTTAKSVGNETSIKDSTLFPQGSNDVLEVLCSGEQTAGKLLMHFLLFYGRHFDAMATCIDVSGTHHPDYKIKQQSKMHASMQLSPFTVRKAGGSYNPITEMYTVDPVIVYDPLEGAESNNVARSCYAWENIRWTFEQCYNTLSGVVELGAGSSNNRSRSKTWPQQENVLEKQSSTQVDELSPLLELLLSF